MTIDSEATSGVEQERGQALIARFREKFGVVDGHELPEDTQRALMNLSKINSDLQDPLIRPLVDNSPSPEAIKKWQEQFVSLFGNKEMGEAIAEKVLKGLTRIGQDIFEKRLVQTYQDAQDALQGLDSDSTRFLFYAGGIERSEEYVKGICKEYFPDDKALDIPSINYAYPPEGDMYESGVIIDDAGYSGSVIKRHIKVGNERYGMKKFVVIVPDLTEHAYHEIIKQAEELGVAVELFYAGMMESVDELLTEEEFEELKKVGYENKVRRGWSLTYFAPKVADGKSFFPFIGYPRDMQVEKRLDALVPKSEGVYRKSYLEKMREQGIIKQSL